MDHTQPHPELYNAPWTADDFNGMPYRSLGRSGLRVSNVGLGTWKFGHPTTGDGARVDERTAFQIFDRAIELGVTFWDTANRYNAASGNSERVIGQWLVANPDQRRNVVIATKVFGGMDGRTPNHSRLSRTNILESVYACLERLQVDTIDLLYFHAYDSTTPIEESLIAVEDLVRQDVVRYFGVSNFSLSHLRAYREVEATLSVRSRMVAIQNQYDIVNGESDRQPGVLAYAASERISFVAWSPLALGLLTERYLDLAKVGQGDRLYDEGTLQQATSAVAMAKLHRLAGLSHEWGLQLSQLALAYMLALPGMGPVIPAVSSVTQLESNAAAGKVVLSTEQMQRVRDSVHDSLEQSS
ncbi:MAG: aldo/keto reductase [Chloroflexi bacterium]|nr:aldo/keto reductase [Chloroflexota bacterium]